MTAVGSAAPPHRLQHRRPLSVRKAEVHEGRVESWSPLELRRTGGDVGRLLHLVGLSLQDSPEDLPYGCFVVHDQNARHGHKDSPAEAAMQRKSPPRTGLDFECP